MAAPLMIGNQLVGMIILGQKEKSAYNEDDKKLLSHVAELVGKYFSELFMRQDEPARAPNQI